jgi:hypothetical protein
LNWNQGGSIEEERVNQQPQLTVVSKEDDKPMPSPTTNAGPLVYCWTILPESQPHLRTLLKKCPRIHRQSKAISEDRVKTFMSIPVVYKPQELPVVAFCLRREANADAVRKFRLKPGGKLFHSMLFDLFLTSFATEPDFFIGKKVVNIDTVLVLDNGSRMLPYLDGTSIDQEQGVGFDLLLAPYDQIWPKDTWFTALTAKAPRNPADQLRHEPIFVEIDE